MYLFDLKGKVIIVTGGYGHLGTAMCLALSNFGAIVYVIGKSQEKFNCQFANLVPVINFMHCDISNTNNIQQSFSEIFEEHQAIDVIVNNAVYLHGQTPLEISDEDWQYSIDGTLNSVYRCIREVVPYFLKNQMGKIVNISSMYGMVSPDFQMYENHPDFLNPPHYGAAKAGVIQLTKYFAQYLGHHNIQVNAISPGPFPNDSVQQNNDFIKILASKTALKRIGRPEDIVGAVAFLSSNAADFVTGHNLVVDGGWTIS
jgi:NAD(P)-dependent dehydrogenase (short-subunit alcohol dehydrogenase family)